MTLVANGLTYLLTAKRLSARLLICRACSWLVGVVPTSLPLQNVIKGVACVQTSITLRIAIEISCLQKVVHAYVTSSFSTVVALVVSLLRHQNGKIRDVNEEETAMGLGEKWKGRPGREQ